MAESAPRIERIMNTPTLRFKEFSGAWEVKKIGEIATVSSGGTPSRANNEFWNGEIPWVTTSEVKFNIIKDTAQKITEQALKNSSAKMFPKNTLLIAMYGEGKTRGQVAKLGIEAATNQACAAIILKNHNSDFFFQYLQNNYDNIRNLSNDGGQKNLSGSLIKSISVVFPTLPEQNKIANFLTAIDEKIAQLSQTAQLLTDYKKGVMQQIFSQQLRFKDDDGREFAEWEVKKLGKFISEYKKKSEFSGQYEVFTSSRKGLVTQKEYFGENRLTERDNTGFNIIPHGYITYRSRSDDGKFTFNLNKLTITGVISTYYPVFTMLDGDNSFFIELFVFYSHIFREYSVGSSQLVLSISELKKISFSIPSLPEQTKIANFLTAIDDKINHNQTQLDVMKQYKLGLLQQMFV